MTDKPTPPAPQHIGDGVYVSFDGYHLNVAVNDHRNHVASLEPDVLWNLLEYARLCDQYALDLQGNTDDALKHFGV